MILGEENPAIPFTLGDLQSSGLLWAINRYVLHEHKLALGIDFESRRPSLFLVYGFDHFSPGINESRGATFDSWLHLMKTGFEVTHGSE